MIDPDPAIDQEQATDPDPVTDPDRAIDPDPVIDPDRAIDPDPVIDPEQATDPDRAIDPDPETDRESVTDRATDRRAGARVPDSVLLDIGLPRGTVPQANVHPDIARPGIVHRIRDIGPVMEAVTGAAIPTIVGAGDATPSTGGPGPLPLR